MNLNLNKYFKKEMFSSFVLLKLKEFLKEINKEHLSGYIKSININENRIIIKTAKPIVNTDLSLYKEQFLAKLSKELEKMNINKKFEIFFK